MEISDYVSKVLELAIKVGVSSVCLLGFFDVSRWRVQR